MSFKEEADFSKLLHGSIWRYKMIDHTVLTQAGVTFYDSTQSARRSISFTEINDTLPVSKVKHK